MMEAQAQAERQRAEEARAATIPSVDALSAELHRRWQEAWNWRRTSGIEARLLDCQERRQGKYDSTKAKLIEEQGGSSLYYNQTATKCRALKAFLKHLLNFDSEATFVIEPTPIPDLPDHIKEEVVSEVLALYGDDPSVVPEQAYQTALDLYDKKESELQKAADETAGRMEQVMLDQLVEGNYERALDEFLDYYSTYPASGLRGPIVVTKKRGRWNGVEFAVEVEQSIEWYAVDPWNLYPGKTCTSPMYGDLFETATIEGQQLSAMRQQPGWNAERIEQVLAQGPQNLNIDRSAEQYLRNIDPQGIGQSYPCIHANVCVTGSMLTDFVADADPLNYYEIVATIINGIVVRAVLNPHKMDRRNLYVASFEPVSGSFWGRGLPELMADCQDMGNAAGRNCANNIAMSSGPFASADRSVMSAAEITNLKQFRPWTVATYDGSLTQSTRDPIKWHNIPNQSEILLDVMRFFEEKADERTGIPRYGYGDDHASGAASTFGGLNILMENLSQQVREIAANLHTFVFGPMATYLYEWNLIWHPDERIKGDARVRARGVLARILEDQQVLGHQEFLRDTANPIDMQILGLKGRAKVLRKIAEERGLMDTVPTEEEIEQMQADQAEQQAIESEVAAITGEESNAQPVR